MSKVAESSVKTLIEARVKRIYGIVGDSLNGITDAIRRERSIQWIHVRHEEVAAFAAGALAQVTGELAVCAGSCGPGNLHLINGLYDAHRSRAPVLASPRRSLPPRLGEGTSKRRTPRSSFANAAITSAWWRSRGTSRPCWRRPWRRPGPSGAWRSWSSRAT